MKKGWLVIFTFVLGLPLFSCAAPAGKPNPFPAEKEAVNTPEAVVQDVQPTREALYVYNNSSGPQEIVLSLNAEPLLLAQSYVRLVGVVSGGKPRALIEIGGRGRQVGVGDPILDYKVIGIGLSNIRLSRR